MAAIKPEGGSHWYTPSGEPCHEVARADGTGMRSTTLADARKLGLLPSVTNILSVLNKPYLNAWKAQQYIDAYRDVIFAEEISEGGGDRVAEAIELAEQRMASPRDLGTLYHHAIEGLIEYWEGRGNAPSEIWHDDFPVLLTDVLFHWYEDHCRHGRTETPFASPAGYGGCIDWYGFYRDDPADDPDFTIIDFKTQATTECKPIRVYNDWAAQLAAYSFGLGTQNARLINLVISTTEPGRIETHEWTEGVEYWYREFERVFAVWRGPFGRNFDPRGE